MAVEAILKRKGGEVVTVVEDATIEQAARLMCERNVGALIVTMGDEVVGLLSSREIVAGVAKYRGRLPTVAVSDLMRRGIVSVPPQEDVRSVMIVMTRQRMTHIPVCTPNGMVGIVSIGDVVKHRLEELEAEANVLREAYVISANLAVNPP